MCLIEKINLEIHSWSLQFLFRAIELDQIQNLNSEFNSTSDNKTCQILKQVTLQIKMPKIMNKDLNEKGKGNV